MANNPIQMIQAFNQFRRDYTPQTAEKKVRELIARSGMSQQQLNQIQNTATWIQNTFNIR